MNAPAKASVKVPPSMAPAADGPMVINALSELPFYTSVLSGRTGSHLVLLPAAVESHLVIIETGIKRALVLFNPDSPVPWRPLWRRPVAG